MMRTVFLALLIALLPLRGWVGDVMAMELVSRTVAAVQPHAHSGQVATNDCPHTQSGHDHAGPAHAMAAEAMPLDTDDGEAHAGGDCASCTVCQICHSVALTAVLPPFPNPLLPSATPQSRQPQYASAERAPGFKPPIS